VFKRVALFLVLSLAAAGVAVSASEDASSAGERTTASRMPIGFYDDEQIFGRTDWAFKQLKSLRAGIVRITIDWSAVARRRPADAADPSDPAYKWTVIDDVVTQAAKNKMRVVAAIYGTPRWAGRGKNRLPRRITDLRLFAFAAATRYSGTFEIGEGEGEGETMRRLPSIRSWLAWNEPNNPVFLKPQWKMVRRAWRAQSAFDYAKICSAVWAGVHSTGLRGEKVACGVTGPRGNDAPRSSRASTSPLVFMRWLQRAGLRRFDAYAHHPYYGGKWETPTTRPKNPKATAIVLGNIDLLVKEVNRLYGRRTRLWITEFGYQTAPPRDSFGLTYAKQASWLRQSFNIAKRNPRIDMFLWFLLKDDSRAAGWQSGLVTPRMAKKPSFNVFRSLK
jgi:hypothetical protein